jgi:hypothetical protein
VEHSLSYEVVRPWRTVAVFATIVAAVELLVILVAGTIWLARPLFSHHAVAARSAAAVAQPVHKKARPLGLTRAKTSVLVLNGGREAGAAAASSDTVKARGYTVTSVGNAPMTYATSVVMFRPGFRWEALRLARDLRVHRVAPLRTIALQELLGAQLVLVVGST